MNSMRKRIRNLGAVVLATAALGLAGAATASAQPARPLTTPYFGMTCWTWKTGILGDYYGNATCAGPGQWYLKVSCTAGFTYNSPMALQLGATEQGTRKAGSCYWGVNSMQIVEVPF
jgi:hypothetical protein